MYCLDPPLDQAPLAFWYCPDCLLEQASGGGCSACPLAVEASGACGRKALDLSRLAAARVGWLCRWEVGAWPACGATSCPMLIGWPPGLPSSVCMPISCLVACASSHRAELALDLV